MSPEYTFIGVLTALVGAFTVYKLMSPKKESGPLVALVDPQVKYPFELVFKEELTHDTRLFRFALPSEQHVLGLPLGQHIYLLVKSFNQHII